MRSFAFLQQILEFAAVYEKLFATDIYLFQFNAAIDKGFGNAPVTLMNFCPTSKLGAES